jgi:hypothetical protein
MPSTRVRREIGTLSLIIGAGLFIGFLLPTSLSGASGELVGRSANLQAPELSLAGALANSPYPVRVLDHGDLTLDHVMVEGPEEITDAPANFPVKEVYAVNLYYRSVDDEIVHMWQTNHPMLGAKDPTRKDGRDVSIRSRTWREREFSSADGVRQVLSTQVGNGITVSIDSARDGTKLREYGATLRDAD